MQAASGASPAVTIHIIGGLLIAVLLAATFAVWWARERSLSIHNIRTRRREAFYWLAILFTFAVGTCW